MSLLISSACSFFAAYLSFQQYRQSVLWLILASMAGPSIAACIILFQFYNQNLWKDFSQKLYLNKIKKSYIPMIFLYMPCLMLSAIMISLLFGASGHQLISLHTISDQSLDSINLIGILVIVCLSCSLEEIGWRGYGIDSLCNKFNRFQASLIFAAIWSLWHIPAFFIQNGYFQKELWDLGIVYVFIYFISLFPITMVMNWLYFKNDRSVLVAILFHMTMNLSYGFVHVELITKIILMCLLLASSLVILHKDKKLFFEKNDTIF